jgi:radical SAM superfamily enzyme YgiQ (UPF0313 family)
MTSAPPIKGPWIHGRKFPPLGLAYVAAALEKKGFQVEILDNYLLEKPISDIKLEIKRLRPEIVGIACGSATYSRCVETAKAVKETLPSCKVVVGGPHPSFMPDSMLQHPEIDYIVMGEGERAIVELATFISKGNGNPATAKIPGVGYSHEGEFVKEPPRFISDLDEVPFPARHLLPMSLYERKIEFLNAEPVDTVNVIRGCPYNCAFCETKRLWGQRCRSFSPNRVVEEINHLITNYGTKGIYFVGDNFTVRKKETAEICELIKKNNLDIEWVCDTRVDLISRDILRKMKEAGCKTIWFGVESGSPAILSRINKGVTLEQITHAFQICREEGIQTACSFMLGIPGETADDMEASFKFARKLNPDWCRFNIFIAVPGSSLYEEIMQKGLYDRVDDFAVYVKTKDFDYESLLKIQRRFHLNFEKSPKRIIRKIRKEGLIPVLKKSPKYFSS